MKSDDNFISKKVADYSQSPQTTKIVDLVRGTGFGVEKALMQLISKALQELQQFGGFSQLIPMSDPQAIGTQKYQSHLV